MRRLAFTALLLLAACGGGSEGGNEQAADSPWPAADGGPGDNVSALAEPDMPPVLDPPWTGRFATDRALCGSAAWEIGPERIVPPGEPACAVRRVGWAAEQRTVELACTAEAEPRGESWTIRATPEGGLALSRGREGEAATLDLVRCP